MNLEGMLIEWARGAGKDIVKTAAVKNVDFNALTSSLVSCIKAVVPPVLAPGFGASPTVTRNDDGTAVISLEFLNKTRNGFTRPVHDIYGLFSQGWDYRPKRPPYGIWHGQYTRALPNRAGQLFVESGVNAWKASVGSGIDVQVDYINPLYK